MLFDSSENHFFGDIDTNTELLLEAMPKFLLFCLSIFELITPHNGESLRLLLPFVWLCVASAVCHLSFCSFDIFFSLLIILFEISFSFNSLPNIKSTMMLPAGSCRTRRSIIPTFVALWNFSTDSLSSLTRILLSLGLSFLIFVQMISRDCWAYLHTMTRTTTSTLQLTTGPSSVALLIWLQQRKLFPSSCRIGMCHGVTTKGIQLGLLQSTILSRKSRSLRFVAKVAPPMPRGLSVRMNFEKQLNFFGQTRLQLQVQVPYGMSLAAHVDWYGLMMLPTSKSRIHTVIPISILL